MKWGVIMKNLMRKIFLSAVDSFILIAISVIAAAVIALFGAGGILYLTHITSVIDVIMGVLGLFVAFSFLWLAWYGNNGIPRLFRSLRTTLTS